MDCGEAIASQRDRFGDETPSRAASMSPFAQNISAETSKGNRENLAGYATRPGSGVLSRMDSNASEGFRLEGHRRPSEAVRTNDWVNMDIWKSLKPSANTLSQPEHLTNPGSFPDKQLPWRKRSETSLRSSLPPSSSPSPRSRGRLSSPFRPPSSRQNINTENINYSDLSGVDSPSSNQHIRRHEEENGLVWERIIKTRPRSQARSASVGSRTTFDPLGVHSRHHSIDARSSSVAPSDISHHSGSKALNSRPLRHSRTKTRHATTGRKKRQIQPVTINLYEQLPPVGMDSVVSAPDSRAASPVTKHTHGRKRQRPGLPRKVKTKKRSRSRRRAAGKDGDVGCEEFDLDLDEVCRVYLTIPSVLPLKINVGATRSSPETD